MEIIPTIDLLAERIRLPKTALEPTDFHICQRNMWFNLHNVKQLTYDIRKQLFADALKPIAINWIETTAGTRVFYTGRTLSNNKTIDGIIKIDDEFKLLSVFVYSSKLFKNAVKNGLLPRDESLVLWNLSLSNELSQHNNKLSESIVFVVCRDTFDMFEMKIENTGIDHINSYINDVVNDEAVPSPIEGHHCNFCDYREFCKNNELASVNCGTCANHPCSFGTSTCGNHLYHPQLMEFAGHSFVAADQARLRIDYDSFVNVTEGDHVEGRACFTSKELFSAAGSELHTDPVLLDLMAQFDGRLECN